MDPKSSELFSNLKQKIQSVISLYEEQKSKVDLLQKKNQQMTLRIEELETELGTLNKKYESIKIAKVLSSLPGEDVRDTKLQVNRIVREIDKCIALLNR